VTSTPERVKSGPDGRKPMSFIIANSGSLSRGISLRFTFLAF
jgi:hypothetical protein